MFSRVMTLGVALAAMVGTMAVAPAALAGNKHADKYYGNAGPGYDYARVVNVEPIVRQVRVEVPQRECWTEDQYEQPRTAQAGVAGNMILGGIIGGVLGAQVGKGDGRRIATAAGALIGSSIGHDVGERRRAEQVAYEPRVRTVERCGVRYINNYEERIEGYDVEYEYCGRNYHTRLPYDPGERMRIRVDVSPAQNGYGRYDSRYEDDRDYGDGDYDD